MQLQLLDTIIAHKEQIVNQKLYSFLNKQSKSTIIFAVIISVILNCLLNYIGETLKIPLYLDSTFTAVTAALFGIIPGILTGLFTNLLKEVIYWFPLHFYPFAVVNMATGLFVGLLVKHGYFKTYFGVFLIMIYITLINALLGALIATIVFGGITHSEMNYIVKVLIMTGQSTFSSAFIARIFVNLVDKGIAVLMAYWIYVKVKQQEALL